MAAFLDDRFPDCISFGSSGGPQYRTTAIQLLSGHEQRNKEWAYPLHVYNVAFGTKTYTDALLLLNFFHAASGRLCGFRYKDWLDYSSAPDRDIPITELDQLQSNQGGNDYQLVKNYVIGGVSQKRIITRIVPGSLVVAVNGTPEAPTGVDNDQGTFTVSGAGTVTAGFEFDVPCRFESDELDTAIESYDNLDTNIRVTEVREGPYVAL